MWGNYNFDFACSMARGRSGGLISMWDPNSFIKDDIWCDDASIIVKGHWRNTVGDCYMITIYGPQDSLAKAILWNRIEEVVDALPDVRVTALYIEEKIKAIFVNDDYRDSRIKLLHEVDIFDTFQPFDFFKRPQMIHGIMKEGVWISDPSQIKEEFLNFFKEKFKDHDSNVDFPQFANSSGLCALDCDRLENPVSLHEVKKAVWNCGSSKAPGFDGSSFAFVKKYWDDIKVDILEYVNIFLDTGSLPHVSNSSSFTLIPKVTNHIFIKDFRPISLSGVHYKIIDKIIANRLSKVIDKIVSHEQSTFIDGRQILDDPLILSVIVEWFKKRRKRVIFKVDFEKAFDSASVLVNDSPTSEFFIKRSLRQGDPLSPFLFILLIKGLHNALSTAISSGLIRGVKFGSAEVTISYLFYADEVIITTE
ncbi:putative RNA-directed DNA polymerase, eukaryota, reverse transcriptase zinc-binding domain protein [Tanacetum coccineum]